MVLTSKHLLNDPTALVVESLQGLQATTPHLSLDLQHKGISDYLHKKLYSCYHSRIPGTQGWHRILDFWRWKRVSLIIDYSIHI